MKKVFELLKNYAVIFLIPALISASFSVWWVAKPNLFNWVYICSPGDTVCSSLQWILIPTVIFLGFVFVRVIALKLYTKTKHWIETPNLKNIKLSGCELRNNEIRLKILNREWRKPRILVSTVKIGIKEQENWLSISHNTSSINRYNDLDIPFIKWNSRQNYFVIVYPDNDDSKEFGFGEFQFDVWIVYDLLNRREGRIKRFLVSVLHDRENGIRITNIVHND